MATQGSNEEIHAESDQNYDRRSELQAFDDTKAGVERTIRRRNHETAQNVPSPTGKSERYSNSDADGNPARFPVIDIEKDPRKVVDGIREAAETWGFFQVVNHGIPEEMLKEMLDGVRRFMEQDTEIKKQYYTRDFSKKFRFNSNFDLYTASTANWRDTFYCAAYPNPPPPQDLPQVCREI